MIDAKSSVTQSTTTGTEDYLSSWICELSESETLAFEQHGIKPNHKAHRHIRKSVALIKIQSDTHRDVDGIAAITAHISNGYVWKGRMSGGFKVRQMRRLVQG